MLRLAAAALLGALRGVRVEADTQLSQVNGGL